MAWGKLGSDTLTGTNVNMTTGAFTQKKFMNILYYSIPTSSMTPVWSFNNDSGTEYAARDSRNGGSDALNTSGGGHNMAPAMPDITPSVVVMYQNNIATEEKLTIAFICFQNTAGAGSAPQRVEFTGKYTETTNPITDMDVTANTSTFAIDSNLSAFGTD